MGGENGKQLDSKDDRTKPPPIETGKVVKFMEILYGEEEALDLVRYHLMPMIALLNTFSEIQNQPYSQIENSTLTDKQKMILSAILIAESTTNDSFITIVSHKRKQKIFTKEFIFQLCLIALFELSVFVVKAILV
jgi:hypothetical protein